MVLGFAVSLLGFAPASVSAQPVAVAITMARDFNVGSDTWTATGAINDAGLFTDVAFFAGHSLTLHGDRTLVGLLGTLTLRYDVRLTATNDPNVLAVGGRWSAISGTGAYATASGAGPIDELFNAGAGTVIGVWSGFLVVGP
jgi:hypothetical protein